MPLDRYQLYHLGFKWKHEHVCHRYVGTSATIKHLQYTQNMCHIVTKCNTHEICVTSWQNATPNMWHTVTKCNTHQICDIPWQNGAYWLCHNCRPISNCRLTWSEKEVNCFLDIFRMLLWSNGEWYRPWTDRVKAQADLGQPWSHRPLVAQAINLILSWHIV